MKRTPGTAAARQAGLLFIAAGVLTIVNNYVPGSEYLDKTFLAVVAVASLLFGLVIPHLPWDRWPALSLLALPIVAFATISLANDVGGVSTYSYASFFIIVFMWIGLHFPSRTSLLLSVPAALAYALPGLRGGSPDGALSSLTIAIPVGVLVAETVAHTVGRLRRAEARFEHGYDLLHRSQSLSNVGSWEWDRSSGVLEWSPEMYRILGLEPSGTAAEFSAVVDLAVPLDRDAVRSKFAEAARGYPVARFEFRIVRPDGAERWLFCEGGVGEDGVVSGFVQDVTDRKLVEEELERLALRDHLTGLNNRRAFVTVGEQLIRIAQRQREPVLCVFVDLDNMKTVNDQFGHAAGDLALIEAAKLLDATFRESDLLARVGGDEFCVLVQHGSAEAQVSLDRLQEAVAARAERFPPVSLSVGVAEYDGVGPCTIESLIERADAAMYEQKMARRGMSSAKPGRPG